MSAYELVLSLLIIQILILRFLVHTISMSMEIHMQESGGNRGSVNILTKPQGLAKTVNTKRKNVDNS